MNIYKALYLQNSYLLSLINTQKPVIPITVWVFKGRIPPHDNSISKILVCRGVPPINETSALQQTTLLATETTQKQNIIQCSKTWPKIFNCIRLEQKFYSRNISISVIIQKLFIPHIFDKFFFYSTNKCTT